MVERVDSLQRYGEIVLQAKANNLAFHDGKKLEVYDRHLARLGRLLTPRDPEAEARALNDLKRAERITRRARRKR